jgi:hypothetical protein
MEDNELLADISKAFRSIGCEPHLIPRGNINHLRGCNWCYDLENLENIDSVAIIAQKKPMGLNSKRLLRFEYALRGNIKDIPSNRNIAYTEFNVTGFIRKKLNSISWCIPKESDYIHKYQNIGYPPKPGEDWEEGPYNFLVELLNEDEYLIQRIKNFIKNNFVKIFYIYSDGWGESIRFSYNDWIDEEKSVELFISPQLLEMAKIVLGHIKVARKRFGGLTF